MSNAFRTLRADEIECRVSQISDKGLLLLLYKDARCDQNVLDETVGPLNWQRHHSRENANCTVSIWDADKKQWIEKEDTGTESNTEAQKGLASDSFKRACFNWGIGRELYTAPRIFIPATKCNITERNGRKVCYDDFTVTEIKYATEGQREIIGIEIAIDKYGTLTPVFSWKSGTTAKKPTQEQPKQQPRQESQPVQKPAEKPLSSRLLVCERCGEVLHTIKTASNTDMTAEEIATYSAKKTGGRLYCPDCVRAWVKEQAEKKMREQQGA